MLSEEIKHRVEVAKARSAVREAFIGLSPEERIKEFSIAVTAHPELKGAITRAELGLHKEKDFAALTEREEVNLRSDFSLSSIGRIFKKAQKVLELENDTDARTGKNILIALSILKELEDGSVTPFSSEVVSCFVGGRCAPKKPTFNDSVIGEIKNRLGDIIKERRGGKKETPSPKDKSKVEKTERRFKFSKPGKKPIYMSQSEHDAYMANKENGIIEQLDWEDEDTGESIRMGFVGKESK